jgi:hypothetical protein
MARFAQYAMVAAEEALGDAGWSPTKGEDLVQTVCCESVCHVTKLTLWRAFILDPVLGVWTMSMTPLWLTTRAYV